MNVVRPATLRPTLTYAEKGHILVSGISYEVLAIFSWPLCKGLFFLIESFFIFFFQVKFYCTWHYSSSVHHMFVQFSTTNQGIVRSTEIIIIFDTYCMKFDWKRDDWCFLFFHATVQTWCGFIRTKFVSLNPIIQCVMYMSITCYSRVT